MRRRRQRLRKSLPGPGPVLSRSLQNFVLNIWCLLPCLLVSGAASASGGVILQGDVCTIEVGFYAATFTAYQPQTSGNEEFCEDLPDTGESIFVLDYLHVSMREVPVSFRIIRDTTGLGRFVQHDDVLALEDIDELTVFYQPPVIEPGASFRIEHDFAEKGAYIGIVTAGHPTSDTVYSAVFPFSVGVFKFPYWTLAVVVGVIFIILFRQAFSAKSGERTEGA